MKNLKLLLKSSGSEEIAEITFEDNEYTLITDYYQEIKRIILLESFKKGLNISYHINASVGETPIIQTSLPPRDDFIVLLHSIRPFLLQEEDLNFYKILKLLKMRIYNKNLLNILEYNKNLFNGANSQKIIKLTVNDILINSEKFLMLYLNAYEYHRDKQKRDFFEDLFKIFPEEIGRFFVISLVFDKVKAIINIGQLIGLILGDIKELNT